MWKNIICRFNISRTIISNNGRQFDNQAFRSFCSRLGIKNHFSSPGQTEVTNQTLLKTIKVRLEGAKGAWLEELPSVLWAYRTMTRTCMRKMPFNLMYGTKAVIPFKVGVTSIRR